MIYQVAVVWTNATRDNAIPPETSQFRGDQIETVRRRYLITAPNLLEAITQAANACRYRSGYRVMRVEAEETTDTEVLP
jgi:hypothetical protein